MSSFEDLVREIVARVLEEKEQVSKVEPSKLYLLGQETFSESMISSLQETYQISFERPGELRVSDILVLTGLSPSQLAKAALGISDDPETELVMQALLRGTALYVLKTSELLMQANLDYQQLFVSYERRLREYGVIFSDEAQLLAQLLGQKGIGGGDVLTRTDITLLPNDSQLIIKPGSVLTYAAKELIKEKRIQVTYDS